MIQNWRPDLFAAISVSLVAMPLGFGIAIASEAPPMAGIITAIIGGLFTTFIRGSHLAINGPAAGLIVVILNANLAMDWRQVLAAIVVAGAIQFILGLLKLGRFGEAFPSSVIHGMLAAIGLIIIAKQIHVAMGLHSDEDSAIKTFIEIGENLPHLNIHVTLIAVICLGIMILYPKIKNKLFHFIPPPIWVLVFSIPAVLVLQNAEALGLGTLGMSGGFDPKFLIQIPDDLSESFMFPDFSNMGTLAFWGVVLSITLIGSIETLISTKAVDKLDPYRRRTNLNKDLSAVGFSTMLCGLVGGLPILTVIVRSSVNIEHGARTRGANFWHGILLLIFVWLLNDAIQSIPLAALAAILIYTGYKLASPRQFAEAWRKGEDQLIIMINTIIATMYFGLLWGITIGVLSDLAIQLVKSHINTPLFFRNIFEPLIIKEKEEDKDHYLTLRGIFNFLNLLRLKREIQKIPPKEHVVLSFADALLVDHTVLEYIHEYAEKYDEEGGVFEVVGLDRHLTSSAHPYALHLMKDRGRSQQEFLTRRQKDMQSLCKKHDWEFEPGINWDVNTLTSFQFFKSRIIEHGGNLMKGSFSSSGLNWNLQDITFDEGAFVSRITYHTTALVCSMPFGMPEFVLEKEELFDKFMNFGTFEDIDITSFKEFSDRYLLKGPDPIAVREFFRPSLLEYLNHSEIYHVESNGNSLMIFRNFRLSSRSEMLKMFRYSQKLVDIIINSHNKADLNSKN